MRQTTMCAALLAGLLMTGCSSGAGPGAVDVRNGTDVTADWTDSTADSTDWTDLADLTADSTDWTDSADLTADSTDSTDSTVDSTDSTDWTPDSTDAADSTDSMDSADSADVPLDSDGDGHPDDVDNCPDDSNPSQANHDDDPLGDACDTDDDDDGVPDIADEAPLDPVWPGLAVGGAIYAHTASALYRWEPATSQVEEVGGFIFPPEIGSEQITDIAVDYEGRLFAVSFYHVFRCSAAIAACYPLAELPTVFNGLTVVPAGTVDPVEESLIGIGTDGSWNLVDVTGNVATVSTLGSYGPAYTSSGDAYSVEGLGTFAAVNKAGVLDDLLAQVDPATGTVLNEVGPIGGYTNVFGLAGDSQSTYAFDASGAILAVDPVTGAKTVALPADQGVSWWGAGVSTRNFAAP